MSDNFHVAAPFVARQGQTPNERGLSHTGKRGDALQGARVKILPLVALNTRHCQSQDVFRVIAWAQPGQIAYRSDQQCRAHQQRQGQGDLERGHSSKKSPLGAARTAARSFERCIRLKE